MLWEISVFIFIFIKSIIGSTRDNGMLQNMGEKSLLDKASFCLSYRPPNDTNITVVWIME